VSDVPAPKADDRPAALRCEDAEAGGFDVPAALITTMTAMAATTSATGTSAVMTGWRERNLPGVGASPALALASTFEAALDLESGTAVDLDCFVVGLFLVFLLLVVVVDRGGRDDPDGDFDMLFS
jgi:hypothetical protein